MTTLQEIMRKLREKFPPPPLRCACCKGPIPVGFEIALPEGYYCTGCAQIGALAILHNPQSTSDAIDQANYALRLVELHFRRRLTDAAHLDGGLHHG